MFKRGGSAIFLYSQESFISFWMPANGIVTGKETNEWSRYTDVVCKQLKIENEKQRVKSVYLVVIEGLRQGKREKKRESEWRCMSSMWDMTESRFSYSGSCCYGCLLRTCQCQDPVTRLLFFNCHVVIPLVAAVCEKWKKNPTFRKQVASGCAWVPLSGVCVCPCPPPKLDKRGDFRPLCPFDARGKKKCGSNPFCLECPVLVKISSLIAYLILCPRYPSPSPSVSSFEIQSKQVYLARFIGTLSPVVIIAHRARRGLSPVTGKSRAIEWDMRE